MSKFIFIVNGYPRSGKNMFASFLMNELEFQGIWTEIHSTVDKVKKAAKILGWNGNKDEHGRNALSSLKDWGNNWFDCSFKTIQKEIDCIDREGGIILMVREPNEIKRIKKEYPETVTVFIQRDSSKRANNHADKNVENYEYDYYIDNNGSLTQLEESAGRLGYIIVNSKRRE